MKLVARSNTVRTSALRHQCTHRQVKPPQAAAGADGAEPLDEPNIRSEQLKVVFSQQYANVHDRVEFPCTVPLLPFPEEQVLLPGSVKTLHLFEARYLALLDDVLSRPGSNKVFAHVVVEQPGDPFYDAAATSPGSYTGDGFVFHMAAIVRVIEVKPSIVGALVRVQAEARVSVTDVTQTWPYFKGKVVPLLEEPVQDEQLVHDQVEQLLQTMRDLQNLTQRFKSRQTAGLQQAMYWAEREALVPAAAPDLTAVELPTAHASEQQSDTAAASSSTATSRSDSSVSDSGSDAVRSSSSAKSSSCGDGGGTTDKSDSSSGDAAMQAAGTGTAEAAGTKQAGGFQENDLAEKAARLSFAALQGVPEESKKDQEKLIRCCLNAMKTNDTSKRLGTVHSHMQNSLNTLAAKCALKSLNLA